LTRRDEYELAEEVLLHIIHSNAYQDVEAQDIIRFTLMGTGRSLSASAWTHHMISMRGRSEPSPSGRRAGAEGNEQPPV
jgi:hypothetical protein